MTVKEQLLGLLEDSKEIYLSGEEAANRLSVSRTAIWKAVCSLKDSGYRIEAVNNRGYRLCPDCDILTSGGIRKHLSGCKPEILLDVKDTVTSTNTILKEKAASGAPEGTVIVAGAQTEGRGRFARHFFSPQGSGIYMSLLVRPGIPADSAVLITTAAAVAVCEAAENLSGRKTGIKWVNDVLIDSKKVCGILTEASLDIESGFLNYAVVGIGLNVYEPDDGFPEEISGIAGAVFTSRKYGQRDCLAAAVINGFYRHYKSLAEKSFINSYREHCTTPGKRITVLSPEGAVPATATGIDDRCRLTVKYDNGSTDALSSGEVSIKL